MYGPDFGKALGCLFAACVILALALAAAVALWLGGVRPDWWMAWAGVGAVVAVSLMAFGGWVMSLFRE